MALLDLGVLFGQFGAKLFEIGSLPLDARLLEFEMLGKALTRAGQRLGGDHGIGVAGQLGPEFFGRQTQLERFAMFAGQLVMLLFERGSAEVDRFGLTFEHVTTLVPFLALALLLLGEDASLFATFGLEPLALALHLFESVRDLRLPRNQRLFGLLQALSTMGQFLFTPIEQRDSLQLLRRRFLTAARPLLGPFNQFGFLAC